MLISHEVVICIIARNSTVPTTDTLLSHELILHFFHLKELRSRLLLVNFEGVKVLEESTFVIS